MRIVVLVLSFISALLIAQEETTKEEYKYSFETNRCDKYKTVTAEQVAEFRRCKGEECPDLECHDLRNHNFTYATIDGANMKGVLLDGALFYGRTVSSFINCDLRGAKFGRPNHNGFSLEGSDLRNADLSGIHAEPKNAAGPSPNLKNAKINKTTKLPIKTFFTADELKEGFEVVIAEE